MHRRAHRTAVVDAGPVSRTDFDAGETYLDADAAKLRGFERRLAVMDRDILLACRDASLGYEHRALLEHLTFTVRAGDYLCVVGENGSGKSTLMKSLLGLLPPLAGTIDCPAQRAGAVGYLPQQTSAQRDFPAAVSEVVLSGFANKRGLHFFYSAAEKERGADEHGQARRAGAAGPLLPRAFRRTAAARAARARPVRGGPPAHFGRAGHGSLEPRRHAGSL